MLDSVNVYNSDGSHSKTKFNLIYDYFPFLNSQNSQFTILFFMQNNIAVYVFYEIFHSLGLPSGIALDRRQSQKEIFMISVNHFLVLKRVRVQ